MEQKTYKYIGIVAISGFVTLIVWILSKNILFCVLAFIASAMFSQSGEWMFSDCRLNSRGFFANTGKKGHSSIIDDDVLPLSSPYEENVSYYCFRPGGSSVWWAPFHGMGDIFIVNKNIVENDDGGVICRGDYCIPPFTDLPINWQRKILYKYRQDRTIPFNPKLHRVFFADTCTSSTPDKKKEAVDYAHRFLRQEGIINTLGDQLEDLQSVMASKASLYNKFVHPEEESKKSTKYKLVEVEEK